MNIQKLIMIREGRFEFDLSSKKQFWFVFENIGMQILVVDSIWSIASNTHNIVVDLDWSN